MIATIAAVFLWVVGAHEPLRVAPGVRPIAVPPAQPVPPSPIPPSPVAPSPVAPALSCRLLTPEAPRGGRLEVEGKAFGKTPVVRISGRAARLLERSRDKLAVQIPRDSNGGSVTVDASGHQAECGALLIIGKD